MSGHFIQLIHAVTAAKAPIHDAFDRLWPVARVEDLEDLSLPGDLAAAGSLTEAFTSRMAELIDQGVRAGADAVLFTCSAFAAAIDAAKEGVTIPVLKPDEAMIERALSLGTHIGGLATFEPSIQSLTSELLAAAERQGTQPEITLRHVTSDQIVSAAAEMTDVDALLLAQFSMVGAKDDIADVPGRPVLTAPDEAVLKLKGILEG
ncbi:MAG: aspartate/glutamate racemase family protein [Rhodospirillales bacterium]